MVVNMVGWRGLSGMAAAVVMAALLSLPTLSMADHEEGKSCPYGNETLEHGEMAMMLAECCLKLVCCNGTIKKSYLDHAAPLRQLNAHPCDNTDPPHTRHGSGEHKPRSCCGWKDMVYPAGYLMNNTCFQLECHKGHWDFTGLINEECGHCIVYDDPHFKTFDGWFYDFHGKCNYSLAQSGDSYDAACGVYGDFKECNGFPTCVNRATFKDNRHTAIEIDHSDIHTVMVNGETFMVTNNHGCKELINTGGYHNVLACMFMDQYSVLIGSSGLSVMVSPFRLDIWAAADLNDTLGGLCGRFNWNETDDFTLRNGTELPLETFPTVFPGSWMDDPCEGNTDYVDLCKRIGGRAALCRGKQISVNEAFWKSCSYDLCHMKENGANRRKMRKYVKNTIARSNCLTQNIKDMTELLED
ncbi:hypothetical protein Pmani_003060 [Petrolisthes manimaculis]|uniref:VWFD domain-containing protein n=1 Tax=Petrolisthes manimaculis TaxID=1843537 RepID=A0AAE1QJQ5_9EUCA|nr:hypothetical protein Pmani_003060 [Petrolisthes manimaculis]